MIRDRPHDLSCLGRDDVPCHHRTYDRRLSTTEGATRDQPETPSQGSVTCDTTLDHVYIEGFLLRSTTNFCLLTGVDRLTEGLLADESAEGNEEESGRPQRLAENTRIRSLY